MLQLVYLSFQFVAVLVQKLDSLLQILIFALQQSNQLTCLVDCLFHHFALYFLFPHRYQNTIQSMSFEFANRIEQLTNKLTQTHKIAGRESRIQEAKEQLIALQQLVTKELGLTQKRMRKLQIKLQRRADKVDRQSSSVDQIWGLKEQRVSEVIGGWIADYEEKMEHAKDELHREELIIKTKLQQQEQMYEREARMISQKIKNQLKSLEKQIGKWESINSQNHSAALKQLASYKQLIIKQFAAVNQTKQAELKSVDQRLASLKEATNQRIAGIRREIDKNSKKTCQIFQLLLAIE